MYDAKGTKNLVVLLGRLGADPELRYTPSNTPVCEISLATNTASKTKEGEVNDVTEWHRIVLWGKLADVAAAYAKKGTRVLVTGRLQTQQWEKDGQMRYKTVTQAYDLQLLDSPQGQSQSAAPAGPAGTRPPATAQRNAPPPPPEPAWNDEQDDLPF